jgi:hypothetical protein
MNKAMRKYRPNFNDPRTQKRLVNAIGFVTAHLGKTPRQLESRLITKELGNKNLGLYLRENLITCINDRYSMNTGLCKKYILNHQGVAYATSSLEHSRVLVDSTPLTPQQPPFLCPSVIQVSPMSMEWALQRYGNELKYYNFNYTLGKDNRWHHGLQNVKKKIRTQVLASANLIHDYDIDSTLPTMILYHNKELGGELYPTILDLIENKEEHRQYLANTLNISVKTAKHIITAVFNGAKNLSPNKFSQIYELLEEDEAKLICLKELDWYQTLKQEIKQCWDIILPHYETLRVYNDQGHKKSFNSSQKWHIYSKLEHKAAVLIRTYLKGHNINYFWIHDGWTSDQQINKSDLERYLREQTNMQLSITYNED